MSGPKAYYQLAVGTRDGRTYFTTVQATEGTPDMTVEQIQRHIDDHIESSWQPSGLFNLGDQTVQCADCGDTHTGPLRINAQTIESIRLVWYNDCPMVQQRETETPPAEAGGVFDPDTEGDQHP